MLRDNVSFVCALLYTLACTRTSLHAHVRAHYLAVAIHDIVDNILQHRFKPAVGWKVDGVFVASLGSCLHRLDSRPTDGNV